MEFFSHKSEIIALCHVFVTQSSLKPLFHVTRADDVERAGISQWCVSVSLQK